MPKYDTDKNDHGYAKYYAQHLPESVNKILEIGVHKSESIKMWHEVYPEARIFGIDLFSEHEPITENWFTAFRGNQADSKLLDNVRLFGPFDFVVDDGSHNSRHQLMTFYGLVGSTKLYVVEDLQCNEEAFYRQDLPYENTMLGMMKASERNAWRTSADVKELGFPFKYKLHDDKIAFIYAP